MPAVKVRAGGGAGKALAEKRWHGRGGPAGARRGYSATAAIQYDGEELDFLRAVQDYQARTGKKFPTFVEILGLVKSLGYTRGHT